MRKQGSISSESRQVDRLFTKWLVIICIVGVAALLILLQVRKDQVARRDAARKTDLAGVHNQLQEYYTSNKKYPVTVDLPQDLHKQLYYAYRISENGLGYRLFARLENSKDPDVVATDVDCGARCNYAITNKP